MDDITKHISLAHGNGGRLMREMIENLFQRYLKNPLLKTNADAVSLPAIETGCDMMMTTDAFTVQPLEFPGGTIGSLAVHGTVNDLAVSGATPYYLSLDVIIEEGLAFALLERVIKSMANAAQECGVQIVCGDTKVVPRGQGGGLYLATTGVGSRPTHRQPGLNNIQEGDAILISGPVGDHGVAVMLAREEFGLRGDVISDAASVLPLTKAVADYSGLRFMRDPTRGGLATALNEVVQQTGLGVSVNETAIPVRESVKSVCDMLGYDPYYLACEGRVMAIIDPGEADEALNRWKEMAQGHEAAIIGTVVSSHKQVILNTAIGGERVLEELEDDPLPRIC